MRLCHLLPLVLGITGLSTACGEDGNSPANTPPTAAFTKSCDILACSFTDGSSDTDGQVTAYTWEFGDGAETATTKDAQHSYPTANTYTVSLTVTDNDGATDGVTQSVQVSTEGNAPPTADFATSCVGLGCSFTDLSTDGDGTVVGFHWDFDDGVEAVTQNSTHAYASAGTYVVELTVTDDDGATGNLTQQVIVASDDLPTIWLNPTSFHFCFRPGSTRNCVHLSQNLTITNVGGGTLNWEATSSKSWLLVSPVSGTAPSPSVTVFVDLNLALLGTNFGSITVSAPGASNSPQTITVRLDNLY